MPRRLLRDHEVAIDTWRYLDEPDDSFDSLDGRRNFALRHRGSDYFSKGRKAVHRAAERNLVPLLAVLIDAEDADVADMVVATRVHAA